MTIDQVISAALLSAILEQSDDVTVTLDEARAVAALEGALDLDHAAATIAEALRNAGRLAAN